MGGLVNSLVRTTGKDQSRTLIRKVIK
jgi:hypothetical protein